MGVVLISFLNNVLWNFILGKVNVVVMGVLVVCCYE